MSRPIDDEQRLALDALLDGALTGEQATDLLARIESDPELRAEYERRRRTAELVRGLPLASAPEGFAASVTDRLPATRPAATATPRSATRSLWLWGSGLAAAAALVIAVSLNDGDPPSGSDWTLAQENTEGEDADKNGHPSGFAQVEPGRKALKDRAAPRDPVKGDLQALNEAKELDTTRTPDAGADVAEAESLTPGKARLEAKREGARRVETAETRARDRTEKRGASAALLALVELRQTVLTPEQRARYLSTATRASDESLHAHMDRLLATAPDIRGAGTRYKAPESVKKALGKAKSPEKAADTGARAQAPGAPALDRGKDNARVFDLVVPERTEAEAIRKLLLRAFPPARSSVADAAKPRTQAAQRVVTIDGARRDAGELRVDWSVSAAHAHAMELWFRRLGLRATPAASGATTSAIRMDETKLRSPKSSTIAGAEAAEDDASGKSAAQDAAVRAPAVPVRVRLRFGPQVRTPERPNRQDK